MTKECEDLLVKLFTLPSLQRMAALDLAGSPATTSLLQQEIASYTAAIELLYERGDQYKLVLAIDGIKNLTDIIAQSST